MCEEPESKREEGETMEKRRCGLGVWFRDFKKKVQRRRETTLKLNERDTSLFFFNLSLKSG
jgi:hypothetical protein